MKNENLNEVTSLIVSKKSILQKIKEKIQQKIRELTEVTDISQINQEWLEEFRKLNGVNVSNNKLSNTTNPKKQEDLTYLLNYDENIEFIDEEKESLFVTDEYEDEFEEMDTLPMIQSKQDFFDIYEKVKNNEKSMDEISIVDLFKINEMLREELDVKRQKLGITEFEKIEKEIRELEEENKLLYEELKKLENNN